MSEAKLDQIVKGAPPPNVSIPQVVAAVTARPPSPELAAEIHQSTKPLLNPTDPLSTIPASPPQIYLNLLILEASLRSQYLALYARRRQHTFFLLILALWNINYFYALFLRPREDGKGHGGSVYWVVDMVEKVCFLGGVLTAILIWGSGQWERGVRWPRRWIGVTNRGLRGMNLKIVILRGSWWRQTLSYLAILFPYRSIFFPPESSYHYVEDTEKHDSNPSPYAYRTPRQLHRGLREEDVAPGGDYVKLLLLPKHFSAEFRENWELYRAEYWEHENARRALLRQTLKHRRHALAKLQGGALWWTGWRGWNPGAKTTDPERLHPRGPKDATTVPRKTRPRSLNEKTPSRSSSRSSTSRTSATPEPEDGRRTHRKTRSGTAVAAATTTRHARARRQTLESQTQVEEPPVMGAEREGEGRRRSEGPPSGRTRQRDLVMGSEGGEG